MNMQNIMKQAQQMQNDIKKIQLSLEKSEYIGTSSLVTAVINGNKEVLKIKINDFENISNEDVELLEDMIMIAINDAIKKADEDKNNKLSKYQGLAGML